MAKYRWQRLDINAVENPPYWLTPDDICYFVREYTPRVGYSSGIDPNTNQLIMNYKKPADRRGKAEWRHKKRAIVSFATELSYLLSDSFTVTCIPSSKKKDDSLYDSRLEDTLILLQKKNQKILIEYPVIRAYSVESMHEGARRNPEMEKESLTWVGFQGNPNQIIIIDDILTTGASFKAIQQIILDNNPDIEIVGVFWARAILKN